MTELRGHTGGVPQGGKRESKNRTPHPESHCSQKYGAGRLCAPPLLLVLSSPRDWHWALGWPQVGDRRRGAQRVLWSRDAAPRRGWNQRPYQILQADPSFTLALPGRCPRKPGWGTSRRAEKQTPPCLTFPGGAPATGDPRRRSPRPPRCPSRRAAQLPAAAGDPATRLGPTVESLPREHRDRLHPSGGPPLRSPPGPRAASAQHPSS